MGMPSPALAGPATHLLGREVGDTSLQELPTWIEAATDASETCSATVRACHLTAVGRGLEKASGNTLCLQSQPPNHEKACETERDEQEHTLPVSYLKTCHNRAACQHRGWRVLTFQRLAEKERKDSLGPAV